MLDLIMLVLIVVSFALAQAYVGLCDRLLAAAPEPRGQADTP